MSEDLFPVTFLSVMAAAAWLLFRATRAAREQHAMALKLLAYALEIREAAYWSSLLGSNLEAASARVTWIERAELERWRDDGAGQAAALATCLVLELERAYPSLKGRLGHSPVSGDDRQRVAKVFSAMLGRDDQGSGWATSGSPEVLPLRSFLTNRAARRA